MKNQTNYNKIVGIKSELGLTNKEIYVVEYTFEDGNFKGVTGYHMSPLYQTDIDDMKNIDPDCYDYLWKDAVAADETTLGLEDYVEELIEEAEAEGKYYVDDDDSFRDEFNELIENESDEVKNKIKEVFGDDVVDWQCSGCGRCFKKNMKFDVVFDQNLLNEINRLED